MTVSDLHPADTSTGSTGRSILERTAVLLQCFDSEVTTLTLKELCALTGLPKSTVHRFADQLLELGWLERSPEGYAIGISMFGIGSLANRDFWLRSIALPYLQQLSRATGCTTQLTVLRDGQVQSLEVVPYRRLRPASTKDGRLPLHSTAPGKVLGAFTSPEVLADTMERTLERHTRHTIVSAQALRDEFTRVRRDGVAFDREESVLGLTSVAAPVRKDGRTVAAVSACTDARRTDEDERVSQVRRCAVALWDQLVRAGIVTSRSLSADE